MRRQPEAVAPGSGLWPARGQAPRAAALDWRQIAASLDEHGYATTAALLSPEECRALATLYECGVSPMIDVANDPGSMATVLGPGVTTTGNVEVSSTCSTLNAWCVQDPECPQPAITPCMQSLIGTTWSASDDGVTGLFTAPAPDGGSMAGGWALQPTAYCALTKGGVPVTGISQDIFGHTRGPMPTIGAAEYDSSTACTP